MTVSSPRYGYKVSERYMLFLLVAIDFYITKNISGRFLVGLRWWTITDVNGNIAWKYETKDVPFLSSLKFR